METTIRKFGNSNKTTLTNPSKLANSIEWEQHLKECLADGDIVCANLNAENLEEYCHFRGINGSKFKVQAEWDDYYEVEAESIISFENQ